MSYGGGGGGGHDKDGNPLKDIGSFLGKNKMSVGTALLNYKMGGGIGKMFAAGQAADLANRYNKEQKYKQSAGGGYDDYGPHGSGGGYGGGGQSSKGHGGGDKYMQGAKGIAGSALGMGKDLFGKAKQAMDGGGKGHSSGGGYDQGYGNQQGGGAYGGGGYGQPSGGYGQPSGGYGPQGGYGQPQEGPPGPPDGAVVSLENRASSALVHIVSAPDGSLVVEAAGMRGSPGPNARWTLARQYDGAYALHNNWNFLGLRDGMPVVMPSGPGAPPPPGCRFNLVTSADGQSVSLHSADNSIPVAFVQGGGGLAYAPHGDVPTLFVMHFV